MYINVIKEIESLLKSITEQPSNLPKEEHVSILMELDAKVKDPAVKLPKELAHCLYKRSYIKALNWIKEIGSSA